MCELVAIFTEMEDADAQILQDRLVIGASTLADKSECGQWCVDRLVLQRPQHNSERPSLSMPDRLMHKSLQIHITEDKHGDDNIFPKFRVGLIDPTDNNLRGCKGDIH